MLQDGEEGNKLQEVGDDITSRKTKYEALQEQGDRVLQEKEMKYEKDRNKV